MSSDWPPSDKAVVMKALARAKAAAEAQVLEEYRAFEVKRVEDLWQLDQRIDRWRRDTQHRFYIQYELMEQEIIDWVKRGWIGIDDVSAFSRARLQRIIAASGKR